MGGYGSGQRFDSKATTSYYRSLDIRGLQRAGVLKPGTSSVSEWSRNGEVVASIQLRSEQYRVWLTYRHRRSNEPWKDERYAVAIDRTLCHYGGSRPWFRCPAVGCGKRVAILYGGDIFACRHCYRLAYDSQKEEPHERALRCTQAIREKLGGSGSLAEDSPTKPKGMHWSTYNRLCAEAEKAQNQSWPPFLLRLRLREGRRRQVRK